MHGTLITLQISKHTSQPDGCNCNLSVFKNILPKTSILSSDTVAKQINYYMVLFFSSPEKYIKVSEVFHNVDIQSLNQHLKFKWHVSQGFVEYFVSWPGQSEGTHDD